MTLPAYTAPPNTTAISLGQIRNEFGYYRQMIREPADPGVNYQATAPITYWELETETEPAGGKSVIVGYHTSVYWNGVFEGESFLNDTSLVIGNYTYYRGPSRSESSFSNITTTRYSIYRIGPQTSTDSTEYALSDYRAGAASQYVPTGTLGYPLGVSTAIPSSGAVSLGNFYNSTKTFAYNYTLPANDFDYNFNLLARATATGFINSATEPGLRANIYIYGVLGASSTTLYAFNTTGPWAKPPIINVTVYNGGYISGAGGSTGGASGGDAMLLQTNILLLNYGIIQGGGGAGAGGYAGIYGGGAGANGKITVTSNYNGAVSNIIIGGRGFQRYPNTSAGDEWGTLDSGGFYQDDNGEAGRANGGSGGGWIVRTGRGGLQTGADGWGTGNSNQAKGGGAPGFAIINRNYLLSGSVTGTIRERVYDAAGTLLRSECRGVDLYGWYANGNGGEYDELIAANSASCQPIDNGGGGGPTCFPAGTQIMMADGLYQAIETIVAGDYVMGMGQPVRVNKIDTPILGSRRMMSFADNSLQWSEEHAMWTRDQTGQQWWWAANADMWRAEVSSGAIGGLTDNYSIRSTETAVEWASIDGWISKELTTVDADYHTQLYLPMTDGSPIIANGYVVGAGVNQSGFDYTALNWDSIAPQVQSKISNKSQEL
jgi:hypothetical protein